MSSRPFVSRPPDTRPPFIFPDPPPPEDMNNTLHLNEPGYLTTLAIHFGHRDTTIVTSEAYISPEVPQSQTGLLYPDLLIAFNAARDEVIYRKGYVIAEQGKPPDFVLEIGSGSTGLYDATEKRRRYAALGIPEYWRFNPSGGRFQRAALAGDRLADGQYQAIPVHRTDERHHWGHSPVLNLSLCWEEGELRWYDPVAERYLPTHADTWAAYLAAHAAEIAEREARIAAEDQRDREREARIAAEARIRQLEEQLGRQQNPSPPETE